MREQGKREALFPVNHGCGENVKLIHNFEVWFYEAFCSIVALEAFIEIPYDPIYFLFSGRAGKKEKGEIKKNNWEQEKGKQKKDTNRREQ